MSNIVLVWAAGSGVSALAQLLVELGYTNIVGIDPYAHTVADQAWYAHIKRYTEMGVYPLQSTDTVIYSAARKEAPEVLQASQQVYDNNKRVSIPRLYFQFVGELSKYLTTIAITGTHGKSTTTALTAQLMQTHHPKTACVLLGAWLTKRNGNNYRVNPAYTQHLRDIINHIIDPRAPGVEDTMKSAYLIVEADEFNKHFLYLDPDYACITNADRDHADIYPTREDYLNTMRLFLSKVRHQAWIPLGAKGQTELQDTPHLLAIAVQEIPYQHMLAGHNESNGSLALAVTIATLMADNIPLPDLQATLLDCTGISRRAEYLGVSKTWAKVFSDYGHHPAEIKSTYASFQKQYPEKNIFVIFQPHQAQRTVTFWDEFIATLADIKYGIIYDIYAARETFPMHLPDGTDITSPTHLWETLASLTHKQYATDRSQVDTFLASAQQDDLILLFSAGNADGLLRAWVRE